jgi:hypothetical protein
MSATKTIVTPEAAEPEAAPAAEDSPGPATKAAGQEPELVYLDLATLRPNPVNPRQSSPASPSWPRRSGASGC